MPLSSAGTPIFFLPVALGQKGFSNMLIIPVILAVKITSFARVALHVLAAFYALRFALPQAPARLFHLACLLIPCLLGCYLTRDDNLSIIMRYLLVGTQLFLLFSLLLPALFVFFGRRGRTPA